LMPRHRALSDHSFWSFWASSSRDDMEEDSLVSLNADRLGVSVLYKTLRLDAARQQHSVTLWRSLFLHEDQLLAIHLPRCATGSSTLKNADDAARRRDSTMCNELLVGATGCCRDREARSRDTSSEGFRQEGLGNRLAASVSAKGTQMCPEALNVRKLYTAHRPVALGRTYAKLTKKTAPWSFDPQCEPPGST
jgi:hypothetical protein